MVCFITWGHSLVMNDTFCWYICCQKRIHLLWNQIIWYNGWIWMKNTICFNIYSFLWHNIWRLICLFSRLLLFFSALVPKFPFISILWLIQYISSAFPSLSHEISAGRLTFIKIKFKFRDKFTDNSLKN